VCPENNIGAAERTARWEADYGRVKAERDQLAAELTETYPQIVAKLVDLPSRRRPIASILGTVCKRKQKRGFLALSAGLGADDDVDR
jgi:hypothetical protein